MLSILNRYSNKSKWLINNNRLINNVANRNYVISFDAMKSVIDGKENDNENVKDNDKENVKDNDKENVKDNDKENVKENKKEKKLKNILKRFQDMLQDTVVKPIIPLNNDNLHANMKRGYTTRLFYDDDHIIGSKYKKNISPPRKDLQFTKLDYNKNKLNIIEKYGFDEIPTLAHGLEATVLSPGVHPINDFDGQPIFSKFLSNIHSLDQVKLHSSYMKPSQDPRLAAITENFNLKYQTSTSSITNVFTQIYIFISHNKYLNTSCFSQEMVNFYGPGFTRSTAKPAVIKMSPLYNGRVWSIDADNGTAPSDNTVLMGLGHSLEKMLTLSEKEFLDKIIDLPEDQEPHIFPDSYIFSHFGKIAYRSQIDCKSDNLPPHRNTFDLKTRATSAVRMNAPTLHNFSQYNLTKISGNNSYEKEFYDIIRSGGIKYTFQARLGHMSGIFIAYHNTQRIFGAEYIDLDELERAIFWSKDMADRSFNIINSLLEIVLDKISKNFDKNYKYRVCLSFHQGPGYLEIFVEQLLHTEAFDPTKATGNSNNSYPRHDGIKFIAETNLFVNPIKQYNLHINRKVNGTIQKQLHYKPTDTLEIEYSLLQSSDPYQKILNNYAEVLSKTHSFAEFANLHERK